jgi:hypothetical protein
VSSSIRSCRGTKIFRKPSALLLRDDYLFLSLWRPRFDNEAAAGQEPKATGVTRRSTKSPISDKSAPDDALMGGGGLDKSHATSFRAEASASSYTSRPPSRTACANRALSFPNICRMRARLHSNRRFRAIPRREGAAATTNLGRAGSLLFNRLFNHKETGRVRLSDRS